MEWYPKVQRITIHTGDVTYRDNLKFQNSLEEIIHFFKKSIHEYILMEGDIPDSPYTDIKIYRSQYSLNNFCFDDNVTEMKIFLKDVCEESVEEAFRKGIVHTMSVNITKLIIQFERGISIRKPKQISELWRIWRTIEYFAAKRSVQVIALCEIDYKVLREIHAFAKIKPKEVYFNTSLFGEVPFPVRRLCREEGIEIYAHSDPLELITESHIKEITDVDLPIKFFIRTVVHAVRPGKILAKSYTVGLGKRIQIYEIDEDETEEDLSSSSEFEMEK